MLFSSSLLFAWVISRLFNTFSNNRWFRLILLVVAYALSLVPIQGTLIAEYIQGYFGYLSIPSIVCILLSFLSGVSLQPMLKQREKRVAFLLIVSAGCFLYPFTMGLSLFDPYALGYRPMGLGIALCATALFAWWLEKYVIMITILLCITLFMLRVGESWNLWDYLIDPLIFFYAIFWLVTQMVLRHKVQQNA